MCLFRSQQLSLCTDEDRVTIENICGRVAHVTLRDRFECSRKIVLVGVQPAHQVAARHPEPLIKGIGLALIRFGNPSKMGKGAQNSQRIVPGAAINYDVLEIRVSLLSDAQDGVLDKCSLVERWCNDGDFRKGCHYGVSPVTLGERMLQEGFCLLPIERNAPGNL